MLGPELLVSVGMGLSFVPLRAPRSSASSERDAGVASALVNTTQQVGSALGTAFLNTVAAAAAASYLASHASSAATPGAAAVHGYTTAFEVSALLLAAAAVVAGVLVRATRHEVREPGPTSSPARLERASDDLEPTPVGGARRGD